MLRDEYSLDNVIYVLETTTTRAQRRHQRHGNPGYSSYIERWSGQGGTHFDLVYRHCPEPYASTAPFNAPSQGPPPWNVDRIAPRSAIVTLTTERGGLTRFRF
jgi:hypothetical protein